MLKSFLRGSSSRGSKGKENEENEKPRYNLPRTAEVRPCELPCDAFLRAARIYDDFYYLAENEGLTDFLHDQREQYLLPTNIFVQKFYFHAKKSPPSVEFHLYDEVKEMSLYDFCRVCKLPFMGSITTKKYTFVMIRVCHSRLRFLSCMYIDDKFMTESR